MNKLSLLFNKPKPASAPGSTHVLTTAVSVVSTGWTGRTVPVICTSAGRALLFDHDLAMLEKLAGPVSFAGLGPGAPSDVAELYRRIEAARFDQRAVEHDTVHEVFTTSSTRSTRVIVVIPPTKRAAIRPCASSTRVTSTQEPCPGRA